MIAALLILRKYWHRGFNINVGGMKVPRRSKLYKYTLQIIRVIT